MTPKLPTAPFPYFGGKGAVAPLVWEHLGDVAHYIEPFCGSAAVLLARPHTDRRLGRYYEMINDKAGFVSNFWRAIKDDPQGLAKVMDWPINEVDLYSRQQWLVARADTLTKEVEDDPLYYDLRAAGWWAWGASCWIGSNWATDGRRAKPNMTPRGINRLTLDLWESDGFSPVNISIQQYLLLLSTRLRQVRVLCGDWKRCIKPSEMTAGGAAGTVGVFLDPPYTVGRREPGLYYHDEAMTADIIQFCMEWGGRARIVLAGMEDEYDLPGWKVVNWSAKRAFPQAKIKEKVTLNSSNRHLERLWLSPERRRPRIVRRYVTVPPSVPD